MARRTARPVPDQQLALTTLTTECPACGRPFWAAYTNRRTVVTLDGPVRLVVQVRRCRDQDCARCGRSVRPETEGRLALPQHEFGLDVVATIGSSATLSTEAFLRSMPSWSAGAWPSAPGA